MRSIVVVAVTFWVSLASALPAFAQFGSRTQNSRFKESVFRNLDRVFKPKLVVSRGASGPVNAMGVSADEHYLVTAVGDKTIRIWDLWLGREIARLSGGAAAVSHVAMVPGQNRFLTIGGDSSLVVWDVANLANPLKLGAALVPASDVVFLNDGATVAVGGVDGSVTLWSIPERRILANWTAHGVGNVRLAISSAGGQLTSAGADGAVRTWDAVGGKLIAEKQFETAVTALAVHESGSVAVGGADGSVTVLDRNQANPRRVEMHEGAVTALSFAPSGEHLISGGQDGGIFMLRDGKATRMGKHDKAVTGVQSGQGEAFSLSVSADGTTRLWNLKTGAEMLLMISTTQGWAVVDAKGRYDGNEAALSGIDWQAEDAVANIEDFAETHYQAALLPRTLKGEGDLAEARTIVDGVAYPPTVSLVPNVTAPVDGKVTVEVTAEDNSGGGVSEIRLYRNGKLVSAGKAQSRDGGQQRRVERYELDVGNGKTVITATALNKERLESRPQTVTVSGGSPDKPGRIHLLTVGVNAYQDKSLNLFYAKPDAVAIDGFFDQSRQVVAPMARRLALLDEQATQHGIVQAIRSLRDVPHEDLIVIYLAGHGVSVEDRWFFISHDANLSDTPPQGLLSSDEMKAEIEALNADRVLLLIDTCHSGTLVDPIKDYRGMKSLRLLARTVGTHVIAATDRTQSAIELQRLGHGIFTYALLAGLAGKADHLLDGAVSATELVRYVEESVPALAREYADDEQYPTGFSRGMDFAISNSSKN
ncbi:WD domain, G-beta repeat [Magnetospirillum gryphiswaldense MSR-1]|uniref:G-protein beta WD-40 repeat n=2 Tax=Magnetospirillum gryphiswaldense TaxID=55518 RepID=A4U256_9PROT|nr:WD domain, G-beta repeat [Magnetospirillum gryphiswaldense MSR-1]AVM78843.1 WD domain, G-beta repeat [Magnetospirillum gryphiswaldense]CAM76963.1 G-protein beta WD-40 repeat [Magnetospirillum gryphiswaldense MSR-1]